MFDFDFAYTGAMQTILFFVSCITTIIFYAYIANLILLIYGEKTSFKRKAVYVLLTGTLMNNIWTYGIYYLGGMLDFSPIIYNLVTIPNPIFALLFFFLGVKVLKLSPYRSVRLLANAYIFIMVIKIFQRLIGYSFFPQPADSSHWNYLIDAVSLIVCTIIYSIIYILLKKLIIKSQFIIRLTENVQAKPFIKEILLLFVKSSLVYAFLIVYPIYVHIGKNLYLFVMFTVLILALIINLLSDYIGSLQKELVNKALHTKKQNELLDGFNSLRHDLNNMLQPFEGYIAVKNWEKLKEYHKSLLNTTILLNENALLNKKMEENPALVSLLMSKLELAEKKQVKLRIDITCNIANLNIDELDLCRAIGNLLDNAIEAAKISVKGWVNFSIDEKPNGSKLIVLSNSTKDDIDIISISHPDLFSKENHIGMGLNYTNKILSKYQNCTFQLSYYDFEFTIYISIS